MGMADGPIFWGVSHASAHIRAAIAEAAADTAKVNTAATARHVRDLAAELDRLELLLEAQWSLLHERLPVTDADLKRRVRELDLEDGYLDGKIRRDPTVVCGACSRKVARKAHRCTYCGAAMDPRGF